MGNVFGQQPDAMGPGGFEGMDQGAFGAGQGGIGSLVGQGTGSYEGMERFSQGGMTPNPLSDLIAQLFGSMAKRGGMSDFGQGIARQPLYPQAPGPEGGSGASASGGVIPLGNSVQQPPPPLPVGQDVAPSQNAYGVGFQPQGGGRIA
ncbi:MAG: hypothetical protein WCE44_02570 [Candidatus Velthaea sp.]